MRIRKMCCGLAALTALTAGPMVAVASAQSDPVTAEDFIDEQGNFDQAGYLAALAAENARGGTAGAGGTGGAALPRTGNDPGRIVGVATAAIVLGGGALLGARRRTAAQAVPGTADIS